MNFNELLDFPFETSLIIVIAAVSLILALLTLGIFVLSRLRRVWKGMRGYPVQHMSIMQNSVRFTAIILWLTISAAVLFLMAFIQSYERFTHKELIAEVRCVPLDEEVGSMYLELTLFRDGERELPREFVVNGDQWALEGDILKWDDWLNFAGVNTMYKLTRVRGRYVSSSDEINARPSVFSLIEREERPEWRWLYRYGHRVRFVSAVYGNTVYHYPSEQNLYQVFVTTSGFIVQIAS